LALNLVQCNAVDGINLEESNCNFLAANCVSNNNHDGIALYNSDNNVIWLNNIQWNDRYGLFLDSSSTDNDIACNLIKHNRVKDAFDGTFDGDSVANDWDHNIGRTDNTGGELLD
jgi:parallel beta-helix repeat protein